MSKKILIVDDSATERSIILSHFGPMGYQVLQAEDGQMGFDMAIEHRPDLIISDIVMPIADGWQMIEMLQESVATQNIPVIAISGKNDNSMQEKAETWGCKVFLTKPVNLEKLQEAVSSLLA